MPSLLTETRRIAEDTNVLFVFDQKDAFRQIRNYLAGRLIGATRDEALVEKVIKCLFCKMYLKNKSRTEKTSDALEVAKRYRRAFEELRKLLPELFRKQDESLLDPDSLAFIDDRLDHVDLNNLDRDPIGDAYEAFIGSGIRGQEGQFFTPQNAIRVLVELVDPKPHERVIDPACGAGGFLSAVARRAIAKGASPSDVAQGVYGIDKDRYLATLAASHISLTTLSPARVFCADSLAWAAEGQTKFPLKSQLGTFDVVLTNPPFGARIVAVSPEVQRSFELGYRWVWDARSERYVKTAELQSSVAPQVLFVERCLTLLRPGGRVGMVVPESLVSGNNYRYVVQFLRDNAHIRAVIGMPESLFKTSGKGGTHTKTCLVLLERKAETNGKQNKGDKIFMAEVQWCGHDSRGRRIERDELPEVIERYRALKKGATNGRSHLGYQVSLGDLTENNLAPRYHNPDVTDQVSALADTHDLLKVADMVASGLLEVSTGDEIGKLSYGSGTIPFVRTSDISNWEIKVDPKHCVSEEVYASFARKQDVQEGDILMVRDGTYLIGTCAYVTKYDTKILFQSHLYKLRITDPEKLSPFLLLVALSSLPVRMQIKAKRVTQDIIDSLGDRIHELVLPIPKEQAIRRRVQQMVETAIQERIEARELARRACVELIGQKHAERFGPPVSVELSAGGPPRSSPGSAAARFGLPQETSGPEYGSRRPRPS